MTFEERAVRRAWVVVVLGTELTKGCARDPARGAGIRDVWLGWGLLCAVGREGLD